jgi:hypothetical protein
LCLNRLLVRYKKYFVFLAIIASFVLTSIFGATDVLRIKDNYIIVKLAIEIDRFLIISI